MQNNDLETAVCQSSDPEVWYFLFVKKAGVKKSLQVC